MHVLIKVLREIADVSINPSTKDKFCTRIECFHNRNIHVAIEKLFVDMFLLFSRGRFDFNNECRRFLWK